MAVGHKTGGRQKGTPNRKTAEMLEAAKAAGVLPHEFLLAVCQGKPIDGHVPTFEERLEAAKAAAPFYAPKLANIDQQVSGEIGTYRAIPVSERDPMDAAAGATDDSDILRSASRE